MTKELSVTNLYGIRGTITHRTDSNVLVVTGENGAGKSSFVDAFLHIFAHKAVKGAPDPTHEGQIEAEATFTDDDGIKYTRRWKNGKMSSVEIRAEDGAKYSQSGEMLSDKIGTITVDVSQFLAVDEKSRRELILSKSSFPDGFDLEELSHKQVVAETQRTDANREVKRLQGVMSALTPPSKTTPDVEQSAGDLVTELRDAENHNRAVRDARENAELAERRIVELEALLKQVRAELETHKAKAAEDQVDVIGLRTKLDGIESLNAAVREKQQYLKTKAEYDAKVAEAKRAADAVAETQRAKFAALQAAEFPIDSLSVDDEFVLVDGVAWPSVNDGEKSIVALATAISGEHADDALKLVILKQGDWLDAKSLKRANDLLAERGFFGLIDRGRPDMPEGVGIDVLEMVDGQTA